jgi:excisionase family DNA binding protein
VTDRVLTVRDVAEEYRVSGHTVLRWITSGDLRAVDVSRTRGKRPTWRITRAAIAAWEQSRTTTPPPVRAHRRRHREATMMWY